MNNKKFKQQRIMAVLFGLLLIIFACSMEWSLMLKNNQDAAKAGFGFVFLCGLSLLIQGITSKNPKNDAQILKENVLKSDYIKNEHVEKFAQATLNAWSNGKLDCIGENYKTFAVGKQSIDFYTSYPPFTGGALRIFLDYVQPLNNEFLIKVFDDDKNPCFVITNLRLIMNDGYKFKDIPLADIEEFNTKGVFSSKTSIFKTKSGEKIIFEKCVPPDKKFLFTIISNLQKINS